MNSILSVRNRAWASVGLLALVGLLVGWVVGRAPGSSATESDWSRPGSAAIRYVADFAAEEAHVFAVAWDDDDAVWFVSSRASGALTLHRHDTTAGTTEAWAVPLLASAGPETFLVQDREGRWWIAANYTLAAFDPKTGTFAVALTLDREHELATAAASDPGAPLPGTWINGIVATDSGVRFTRNHVRGLFGVDVPGLVSLKAELDRAPDGLVAITGEAHVDTGPASLASALPESSPAFLEDQALAVADAGSCTVVVSPAVGGVYLASPRWDGLQDVAPGSARAGDLVTANRGGWFAVALNSGPALLRGTCDGGAAEVFELAVAQTADATLRRGHFHQLLDAPPRSVQTVLALAVNSNGAIVLSDALGRVGIIAP